MLVINKNALNKLKYSAVKQAELANHVGVAFSTVQRWIYKQNVNCLSRKPVMDKIEELTGEKILEYAEPTR